jgi:hypothetical protein
MSCGKVLERRSQQKQSQKPHTQERRVGHPENFVRDVRVAAPIQISDEGPEASVGVAGAAEKIAAAMGELDGVVARPHRFGGTEYRLGRREIGHVHEDHLVDIPFAKKTRKELVAAGKAERHRILPESGWVSVYLRQSSDVERAIELLRLSLENAVRTLSKS